MKIGNQIFINNKIYFYYLVLLHVGRGFLVSLTSPYKILLFTPQKGEAVFSDKMVWVNLFSKLILKIKTYLQRRKLLIKKNKQVLILMMVRIWWCKFPERVGMKKEVMIEWRQ